MKTISKPDVFRINIRNKINEIIEDENKSVNLEKGVFNYAIKEANNKKLNQKNGTTHLSFKFI